jgi:hypothetical protein
VLWRVVTCYDVLWHVVTCELLPSDHRKRRLVNFSSVSSHLQHTYRASSENNRPNFGQEPNINKKESLFVMNRFSWNQRFALCFPRVSLSHNDGI